jgi:hypothetical protein
MADWFEEVTKTLADDKLSRRQAIWRTLGIIAGAALASVTQGTGEAFALAPRHTLGQKCSCNNCSNPGTCSTAFPNCGSNQYNNCYCFQDINGSPVCGCNSYCASSPPCSTDADCATGYVCITNTGCGCTTGVCVPICNQTCQLSSDRAGRTAADFAGIEDRVKPFGGGIEVKPGDGGPGTVIKVDGAGFLCNMGGTITITDQNKNVIFNGTFHTKKCSGDFENPVPFTLPFPFAPQTLTITAKMGLSSVQTTFVVQPPTVYFFKSNPPPPLLETVRVEGWGFLGGAGETVDVTTTIPGVGPQPFRANTRNSGAFSGIKFTIPGTTPPGTYTITAVGETSKLASPPKNIELK